MKLERNWNQHSMGPIMTLDGAIVTQTVKTEISMSDILEFVQDNWLEIKVAKREEFKREIQKMELGLKEPPPYDGPEPIRW